MNDYIFFGIKNNKYLPGPDPTASENNLLIMK
jgi:hypothetical protein